MKNKTEKKFNKQYEKPILLDLEDVVAGCTICDTGGGRLQELRPNT